MQKVEITGSAPTLEVSTWFQVHRDRDEYCCELALVAEKCRVSCTAYSENRDFFDGQLIEFAKALIDFVGNPEGLPTLEVGGGDPDCFEACSARIRVAQACEGLAQLEFRHSTRSIDCGLIMGRISVEVEEAKTFHIEIPMEDVRDMAYGLLSKVTNDKDFIFCLRPAPPQ